MTPEFILFHAGLQLVLSFIFQATFFKNKNRDIGKYISDSLKTATLGFILVMILFSLIGVGS